MRDTLRLRARIHVAIGHVAIGHVAIGLVPLTAASLSACAAEDAPPPVSQRKQQAQADTAKKPGKKADKANGAKKAGPGKQGPDTKTAKVTRKEPKVIRHGETWNTDDEAFDYYGPARDPYAPHNEEDGCPNGDWCGAPADAKLFSNPRIPEQMGCAERIYANPKAEVNQKAKKWKGFSFHPMMQGRLMTTVTQERRTKKKKDQEICCYHWFEYCSGRPLFDGAEQVMANLRPGVHWCTDAVNEDGGELGDELTPDLCKKLALAWAEDARMEHAAIAAFARTTLELLAAAAPAELVAACQVAGLDEVRHAQLCLDLAHRYSGAAIEPGPLPALAPRPSDPVRLAVDTFVEGCVGETIAALIATRAGRECREPAVAQTLATIAEDEGAHACLAWRTIEWMLSSSDEETRERIEVELSRVANEMRAKAIASAPMQRRQKSSEDRVLEAHGRLGEWAQKQACREAWTEIIMPTLQGLLVSGMHELRA